ncbi:MAG TPA: VOC family protein [Solirubrobacteraceae bacterium]|nr:VOC family protein [Solirubrobacteraceae bacterium]
MTAFLRCEIFPSDLDATAAFYTTVLGLEIERDEHDADADAPYLALRRGTVRLGAAQRTPIGDPAHRRPPTGVELVLETENLEAERERVAQAGWPLIEDITPRPWGLRDFRLLDPNGYYWRVTTHAREAV